jgi:formylglycine-generating enzyme required for sulfatase activity/TolB-like protein
MKIVRANAFLLLFLAGQLLPAALFAQKKESLAVFAFTGGAASDGEAIAGSLTRQAVLRNSFNKTTLITQAIRTTMNFEQRFQRNSGLTDADTIFELGKALNASHVIAGYITRLGDRNLVLVSIMDVESLQQIAGDYRSYRTIEEINALIPDMAASLARAVTRDTRNLPGLSVPPFVISREVNQSDAMTLAQILSCDLANAGKYAVLPRTDSLERVMEEQRRQRDGTTDQERTRRLGAGRNAQYVLSGRVERLGTLNKFVADILDILDGSFIDGYEEDYTNFAQGFELMPKLAALLSGQTGPGPTSANFVRVEGGTFTMGTPSGGKDDERPVRTVTVKSFSISKYEVTQKEWYEVMGTTVRQQRDMADRSWPMCGEGDNHPMYYVNWYEAVEYCNRRSVKEGLTPVYRGSGDNITCDWNANGYRLPTEAEWEFAARGGTKEYLTTEYSGSNSVGAVAWYSDNSGGSTKPVGTKAANSLGIHDMSGNVWEWCWDWYGSYTSGSQTDPRGSVSGASRVRRGGGWFNKAAFARSAYRGSDTPSDRGSVLGFRLVRP